MVKEKKFLNSKIFNGVYMMQSAQFCMNMAVIDKPPEELELWDVFLVTRMLWTIETGWVS